MSPKIVRGIGMTSARTQQRLVERLRDQGIHRLDVLNAIATTPRHRFIDEALAHRAYDDTALPIGFGQTISQPYIVALMTQTILDQHQGPCQKVLEIGSGSGYQAAVLANLVKAVYSIERVESLYHQAKTRLKDLGHPNVFFRYGDGYAGWPEEAPFDAIIVTAAAPEIPESLKLQLASEGGIMVLPIGKIGDQDLALVTRHQDDFKEQSLCPVRFVPFLPGLA